MATKTIKFKPEFEKKLKDLGIKTRFVKNFLNRNKKDRWTFTSVDNEKALDYIQSGSFTFLIFYAFNWELTPEGHGYWLEISILDL